MSDESRFPQFARQGQHEFTTTLPIRGWSSGFQSGRRDSCSGSGNEAHPLACGRRKGVFPVASLFVRISSDSKSALVEVGHEDR